MWSLMFLYWVKRGILVVKDPPVPRPETDSSEPSPEVDIPRVLGMNVICVGYAELFGQYATALFDIPLMKEALATWRKALQKCL